MHKRRRPEALYNRAVASGVRGNHAQAVRLLSQAILLQPTLSILHGQLGNALCAQHRYEAAVASFERALSLAPDDPDHYNNLGNVFRAMRRIDDALATYRKGLELRPAHAPLLTNLGIALAERGDTEQAAACFRSALASSPDCREATQGLANVLKEQRQLDEALPLYENLVDRNPDLIAAHLNLGIELQNLGKLEEAIRCYRKVIALRPEMAAAHNNLGSALRLLGKGTEAIESLEKAASLDPEQVLPLCNLGSALQAEKKWGEAWAAFHRALALEPNNPEICNCLGTLFCAQENFDAALEWYARAKAIKPEFPEVDSNIANVFRDRNQLEDAEAQYRLAIERKPVLADAYNNLGNTLKELGRYDESVATYQKAIELKPDNPSYRWNQALTQLAAGDLDRGWEGYEFGFACKQRQQLRPFPQPRWQGESLTGKTILTWGEQGVGDEIMFANCIPDLAQAADSCIVECDPRLVTLFARSFPDCEVVPRHEPCHPRTGWPDIDLQVPMGSLPRWLRRSISDFPRHGGYLTADPARVRHWQARLAELGGKIHVGISWRSRLMLASRRKYYVPLDEWAPILGVPGAQFVNLQYSDYHDDLAAAESRFGVRVHDFADLNLKDALDDVGALIAALDLVITIGNINMDLAGGLHTETWLFSPRTSQSWATLGENYTPWFPSVRLLQRDWNESWEAPMAWAAAELRARATA